MAWNIDNGTFTNRNEFLTHFVWLFIFSVNHSCYFWSFTIKVLHCTKGIRRNIALLVPLIYFDGWNVSSDISICCSWSHIKYSIFIRVSPDERFSHLLNPGSRRCDAIQRWSSQIKQCYMSLRVWHQPWLSSNFIHFY